MNASQITYNGFTVIVEPDTYHEGYGYLYLIQTKEQYPCCISGGYDTTEEAERCARAEIDLDFYNDTENNPHYQDIMEMYAR